VILLKLRNSSESQQTRPLNRSQPQKLSFGSGSKALDGQQLILGTIATEAVPDEIIPKDANRIVLSNEKYSVLRRDQFSEAISDVGEMHELLLAT
jgi:hypothetical protein